MTVIEYEEKLASMAAYLKKNPCTVQKLCRIFKLSKQRVGERLRALRERGYKFKRTLVREGTRGPKSAQYQIVNITP